MNPFTLERDCYVLLYEDNGLSIGKLYPMRVEGALEVLNTRESPIFCFVYIYDEHARGLSVRLPTRLGRFIQWIR